MYVVNDAAQRARWEVRWAVRRKGKIKWIVKDCGFDFALALRVYDIMRGREAAGVTLRCKNMAFPPPDEFADPKYIIVTKRIKGKMKRYKKKDGIHIPRTYETKMHEVNLLGKWWCPYCIKFRKFVKNDRAGGAVMACPCCGASNLLATVQRYNPLAARDYTNLRKTRSDKGKART